MKLYHRTSYLDAIIACGFEDRGDFVTRSLLPDGGVWLSDEPLPKAFGTALLSIEIPEGVVGEFEQSVKRRGVREFLVPAEVANRFGPPGIEETDR